MLFIVQARSHHTYGTSEKLKCRRGTNGVVTACKTTNGSHSVHIDRFKLNTAFCFGRIS